MASAGTLTIDLRGLASVSARLLEKRDAVLKAVRGWAYAEALEAMAFSQNIVPVDTGALKASGHVEAPEDDGVTISVTLGYGGVSAPYAWRVHEDLSMRHDGENESAKFLELGLLSRQKEMMTNLEAVVSAAMRE